MVRIMIECSEHDAKTLSDGYFTEPAPPKDWRPACYNYSELVNGCAQIPFTDKPGCQECPYRNLE